MSKVIKVRYEKGVLKPLEPLDLREGEEVRIQVLPEEFPELADKVSVEASEDTYKILREARERWKRWYWTIAKRRPIETQNQHCW
ncbi:hypothetical protein apy_12500 [Aeropyrum pernix]|uniref:Antitoxin n=1 Tax=Aeropyrum pernix TaxID=56636 RepID=A0A401HAN7_AERPX|nr:antitoxin family protein [Aeropyrum pernix]GBF09525.1 hypothetical protein apy_12500 [Aeropyrum pernix]